VPDKLGIGRRALSALASIGAIEGASSFNHALDFLGDAMFQALADQAAFEGVSEDQHFREKVAFLQRRYNTGLNGEVEEPEEESPEAREYRRQTRG
jgi:hypothetical protein